MKDIKSAFATCLSIVAVAIPLQFAEAADTSSVIIKIKPTGKNSVMSDIVNTIGSQKSIQSRLAQAELRTNMVKQYADSLNIKPKNIYSHIYSGFSADVTPSQLEALRNNPNIEVHKDMILTTQGKRKLVEWPQILTNGPVDSGAVKSSYTGDGVHVYVLDSGIDYDHKDIAGNLGLSYAPEFCHFIDDSDACPQPFSDDNGHGTHVSGIIAAQDNRIDVRGVAPDAIVHAVKVCNQQGSCPTSSILAGLNWAVFDMLRNRTAAVANMSLGGAAPDLDIGRCTADGYESDGEDTFLGEAYCNAARQGLVIVVAAGNSNADAADYVPAKFDSTITVSSYLEYEAAEDSAVYSSFSNWSDGSNSWSEVQSGAITVGAAGSNIDSLNRTHAYISLSGTSMASPVVAGAAALILEKYPQPLNINALNNVRSMIVDNATYVSEYSIEEDDDSEPAEGRVHNEGLINIEFLENSDTPD